MISISGVFAVTFSVVFAYVADVTTLEERSRAYGLVSATFAASLVSLALHFFFLFNIIQLYSFILQHKYTYILGHISCSGSVPAQGVRRRGGSRPGNGNRCAGRLFHSGCRAGKSAGEGATQFLGCTDQLGASWSVCSKLYKYVECKWIFNQWDVYYQALRKVGLDHTILMQCVTVLLSYLPEAGQYSCIFVYLNLKMGFSSFEVAVFIAVIGILSIAAQLVLGFLMR